MKNLLLSLIAILMVGASANAAPKKPCPEMMQELRGKRSQQVSVTQASYVFAKDALAHYRSNQLGEDTNVPHIDGLYRYLSRESEITGYRIGLTDGGDESHTSYYFNSRGKLVYAKNDNQTPRYFWFCGQKTALEK